MSDVVWDCSLDDKYRCVVERIDHYNGTLKMYDYDGKKLLLEERVGLSYGALFGPDVADVAVWQQRCIEEADKHGG